MISSNITTCYAPTSQFTGAGLKTSSANAALFQSILQSQSPALRGSENSAFGIGSTGTKTIISSPLKMNIATLANISVTDVNATAAVSGEKMQMEDYLDIYKNIYDKYAAIYGDGFEFTVRYSFQGNAESMAAERKVGQMLDDFHRELHANIPSEFLSCSDPDFALRAASSGLTLREYAIQNGSREPRPIGDNYVTDSVSKLFYLEKYSLEGLSTKEQTDAIMTKFGKGTFGDFSMGIGILYQVGAIADDGFVKAVSEAITHIDNKEFEKALEMYDSNSIGEFLKQYYANIIIHISNMLSAEYDWEDVFKNNLSNSQYNGKDSLVIKLFGSS